MSQAIRVIVVNADEEAAPELRNYLLSVEGVKIVAEIDEPVFLAQALDQFPAEVLLVHLDPNPTAMMDVVAPLIEARKETISAIAMTEDRDAELVMRAMRAGMREFLWKPFPPEQLNEILGRVGGEATTHTRQLGRIVPVIGTCGGVGATTLATNLAVELAQIDNWQKPNGTTGRPRVTVVDLDFRFGQVATFLDAQVKYTIAELCDSPERIEPQMIDRVMVKHPSGVHVLAHPESLEQAERISAAHTAGALSALQEHYDFVVVDGPVRFDPTARAVLDTTDICMLVIQLLVPSVRNADRVLREMERSGYNMERVRLVCNRCGRDANYLEVSDVEATLNRRIDWKLVDDWKTSSTSVNVGSPLLDFASKSKLRAGYQEIAAVLATVAASGGGGADIADAEGGRGKGLLSFFGNQKGGA